MKKLFSTLVILSTPLKATELNQLVPMDILNGDSYTVAQPTETKFVSFSENLLPFQLVESSILTDSSIAFLKKFHSNIFKNGYNQKLYAKFLKPLSSKLDKKNSQSKN